MDKVIQSYNMKTAYALRMNTLPLRFVMALVMSTTVTESQAKLHCSSLAQSVDIGLSPHATKVSVLGYKKAPKQPSH